MEELENIKVTDLQIDKSIFVIDKSLTEEDKSITVCEIKSIDVSDGLPKIRLKLINGTFKFISKKDEFNVYDRTIKGTMGKENYYGFLTLQEAIDFRNDLISTRIGELEGMYL